MDETIQVGAGTSSLVLPAGPYLRVSGDGVRLTIGGAGGVSLEGSFAFEQQRRCEVLGERVEDVASLRAHSALLEHLVHASVAREQVAGPEVPRVIGFVVSQHR